MLDSTTIFGDAEGMAYHGGKNGSGVYQTIINLIPPHDTYIEPFLGAGAIMRLKCPAARNIGIDNDPEALKRFEALTTGNGVAGSVTLRNDDAFGFLQNHPFTGREFVYCDPPYLHETRVKLNMYRDELAPGDHARLLDILKRLPCMVMISGYWTALYTDTLQDWHTVSFQAMTRSGKPATEWLWMNYLEPVALHDYRYLGADFRERERIRKKVDRWLAKLEALPALERRALLSAITAGISANEDAAGGTTVSGEPGPRSRTAENGDGSGCIAISGDTGIRHRQK